MIKKTVKPATNTIKPAPKKTVDPIPKSTKPQDIPKSVYYMTNEVKQWIDHASSTIQHLRSKVEMLETENRNLKAYRKFAEHRILRSEAE